jgi:hypothetical protein
VRGDHGGDALAPRRGHGPAEPFSALGQAGTVRPQAGISSSQFLGFSFFLKTFIRLNILEIPLNF